MYAGIAESSKGERSMRRVFRSARLIVTISAFGLATSAMAAPRAVPLTNGMSFGEVLQAWGAPKDKLEFESRRKDVWIYPDGRQVTFEDGKVQKSGLITAASVGGIEVASEEPEKSARLKKPTQEEVAVEDILEEIMREVPEGASEPSRARRGSKRKR